MYCLFVHCSLLSFFGYDSFWYCVVFFPIVCQLYCFQLEGGLIVHCRCIFCFTVSGFQIVLDCLLEDLSFCVSNWSLRYWLAVIYVVFTCLLFLVISHHVFVVCIVYDLLLWLWSSFPTTVPWAHGPLSSHWTTIVVFLTKTL